MRRTILGVAVMIAGFAMLHVTTSVHAADDVIGPYPGDTGENREASPGSGTGIDLVTIENGVAESLQLTGVQRGNLHSLWLVNVSNPENCETPRACTAADLLLSSRQIGAEVDYLAGMVAGENGTAVLAASDGPGDVAGELLDSGDLDSVQGGTHLMVIDHGPIASDELSWSGQSGTPSLTPTPDDGELAPEARYGGTPGLTR